MKKLLKTIKNWMIISNEWYSKLRSRYKIFICLCILVLYYGTILLFGYNRILWELHGSILLIGYWRIFGKFLNK